jgi:hypothetical protein
MTETQETLGETPFATLTLNDVDEFHRLQRTVLLKTALLESYFAAQERGPDYTDDWPVPSLLREALHELVREIWTATESLAVMMDRAQTGKAGADER